MTLSGGTSQNNSDRRVEDLTVAINNQVELFKKNFTAEVEFTFDFNRGKNEVENVARREPTEKRYAQTQAIVSIQYEKYQVDKAGTSYYHAKVKLNPLKALTLLSRYDVSLDFRAARTYREKDFPKTSDDPELPPAGIVSDFGPLPEPMTDQRIKGKRVPVLFSYQFDIRNEYWPGDWANKDDFLRVRMGIWHEIMECTLLSLAAEALYMPKFLYYDYMGPGAIPTSRASFAQIAVCNAQKRVIIPRKESLFLYWDGDDEDPPFDSFEVGAYLREQEARDLEDKAIMLERQGNWAGAREKWIEAEDAWEIAIRAWEAVPRHPGRSERIDTARTKLAQAREKRLIAQWKGASWDVTSTSSGEINIRYSAWPDRFKAKIADVKGHVLASFDKPSGTGVIIWGKGVEAGLYFIRVEAERIEPMVRKIVIF